MEFIAISPLFKALKILSIYQMYEFFVILLVYKFERKCLPSIFIEMFNYIEIQPCNFRQSQEFPIPFYRLTCYQNSFRYTAIKL